jgi:hypothetical protein
MFEEFTECPVGVSEQKNLDPDSAKCQDPDPDSVIRIRNTGQIPASTFCRCHSKLSSVC